jgi:hypothetical protein
MSTSSSSNINRLSDSHNKNPNLKTPIRFGDTMFIAIPEHIVQYLHIEEQRTWFEVIPTSEGFRLRKQDKIV